MLQHQSINRSINELKTTGIFFEYRYASVLVLYAQSKAYFAMCTLLWLACISLPLHGPCAAPCMGEALMSPEFHIGGCARTSRTPTSSTQHRRELAKTRSISQLDSICYASDAKKCNSTNLRLKDHMLALALLAIMTAVAHAKLSRLQLHPST